LFWVQGEFRNTASHSSPHLTEHLAFRSCAPARIPFCDTTPKHTLRSPFSQYPSTPGSRFVSCTRSRSLTVAISMRSTVVLRLCLKFGPVGGGGGVCSSYNVGPKPTLLTVPHIRHANTPVLEFEAAIHEVNFNHVTCT